MMDVPDWLRQNIATNLLTEGLIAALLLAWKYREWIRHRLEPNRDITISMNPANLTAEATPVLLSATIQGKSTVEATATVEKSRGTPSLARRLEELVSWFLHVS
jgi:hypothetical protein